MTINITTFSDDNMDRSSWLCVESAKANGAVTHSRFNPGNIAHYVRTMEVVRAHPEVFRQPEDPRRAWAWWAFKPLIISAELNFMSNDSICIYSDAGVEFLNSVNYIIDRMDQDIFLFGNNYEHAHWCKRDIIEAIFPSENPPYMSHKRWDEFGKQVQASVIFFRVNNKTRAFVKEWLDWCLFECGRLIDDSRSRTPNHPEFQENRHDQAILTTMAYRDGYKLHYWPASYNDGAFTYEKLPCYAGDDYPILFNHHRGVKTGERAA